MSCLCRGTPCYQGGTLMFSRWEELSPLSKGLRLGALAPRGEHDVNMVHKPAAKVGRAVGANKRLRGKGANSVRKSKKPKGLAGELTGSVVAKLCQAKPTSAARLQTVANRGAAPPAPGDGDGMLPAGATERRPKHSAAILSGSGTQPAEDTHFVPDAHLTGRLVVF
jgi:hypothetical protein